MAFPLIGIIGRYAGIVSDDKIANIAIGCCFIAAVCDAITIGMSDFTMMTEVPFRHD